MKILLAAVFMTLVFLADAYPSFLLLMAFTLTVAILTGKHLKQSLKGLKAILFIAVFTMVLNTFAVKGASLCGSGFFSHVTREGVVLSIQIVLRLFLLLTGASLLTSTTTPVSLMDGMEALLKPLKRFRVPVHEAATVMAMALRFIPVLLEEAERIYQAQASRSAVFDSGNPLKRAGRCVPVLVPLFMGAFRRADELAMAMESRCYRGSGGRTRMRRLSFSRADGMCAAAMFALTAAFACVEYAM
jgi:energy-coupling factor transport system permease protein